MANQQAARPGIERFDELLDAGRTAALTGDRRLAHDYLKEAARLNPSNEQVWTALLEVIETEEDQRVCLQNIIQINPLNVQARRKLNQLESRRERRLQMRAEEKAKVRADKHRRRTVLSRAMMLGLLIGVVGVIFGIVMSLVVYGPK